MRPKSATNPIPGANLDLERLAKVWSLTSSPNTGEAIAARDRARTIVEGAGLTLDDVPDLLAKHDVQQSRQANPVQEFTFRMYNLDDPADALALAESFRAEHAARIKREAPARAEVIKRYGSVSAALAWTGRETLVRAAVAPWSTFAKSPGDTRWINSIDGYTRDDESAPPRVLEAIANAFPMPETITEAAAEFASWERRDRDLGLVLRDTEDSKLDLPADLRRDLVRKSLETGLRATCLAEVVIRQRHLVESDFTDREIHKAVLRDLEHLVAMDQTLAARSEPAIQPDLFG